MGNSLINRASVAGGKEELLWTNPSPTSNFPTQTLDVDLNGYDYVKIKYNFSTSIQSNEGETIFEVSKLPFTFINDNAYSIGTTYYGMSRAVFINNGKLSFGQAYQGGTTSNSNVIPSQIYGIKGTKLPVKVLTNRTLLWENPNISQTLSARTVNYTGTYNAYEIDWAISTSDQTIKTTYIGADYKTMSTQLWSNDTYGRKITINASNIEWTDGTYYYGTSNTWCIIKAIYGITI